MKKFAKTFLITTGISLLLYWVTWYLYDAVSPKLGLLQFFGFLPSPPPSIWQNMFSDVFIVLSIPESLMMSLSEYGPSKFVLALFSLANSVAWGFFIGFPIYIINRRFFTRVA